MKKVFVLAAVAVGMFMTSCQKDESLTRSTTPDENLVALGTSTTDPVLVADLDCDGMVGDAELAIAVSNMGLTDATVCKGDFNGDGVVDTDDVLLADGLFGTTNVYDVTDECGCADDGDEELDHNFPYWNMPGDIYKINKNSGNVTSYVIGVVNHNGNNKDFQVNYLSSGNNLGNFQYHVIQEELKVDGFAWSSVNGWHELNGDAGVFEKETSNNIWYIGESGWNKLGLMAPFLD